MTEIQNEMLELGVYALIVRGQGKDLLMGINVHNYTKIDGLEELLHNFIADLDNAFNYIYKNDIAGYINDLKVRFGIDLDFLQANLEANILAMQADNSDDIMLYYLVITKTLEHMRTQIYEHQGKDLVEKEYQNQKGGVPPTDLFDRIDCSNVSCGEDASLLINLVFTQFLAKKYHKHPILEVINSQIKTRLTNIFSTFT